MGVNKKLNYPRLGVEGFRKHVDCKSTSFQGSLSLSFLWKQESKNN